MVMVTQNSPVPKYKNYINTIISNCNSVLLCIFNANGFLERSKKRNERERGLCVCVKKASHVHNKWHYSFSLLVEMLLWFSIIELNARACVVCFILILFIYSVCLLASFLLHLVCEALFVLERLFESRPKWNKINTNAIEGEKEKERDWYKYGIKYDTSVAGEHYDRMVNVYNEIMLKLRYVNWLSIDFKWDCFLLWLPLYLTAPTFVLDRLH